jgi:hypothetical protein
MSVICFMMFMADGLCKLQIIHMIFEQRTSYIADLESRLLKVNDLYFPDDDRPATILATHFQKSGKSSPIYKELTGKDGKKDPADTTTKLVQLMHSSLAGKDTATDVLGYRTLDTTTCGWQKIPRNSRARDFPPIARAAIVERWRQKEFRKPLVLETTVAYLRVALEAQLSEFAVATFVDGKAINKWRFRDGFVAPIPLTVPPLNEEEDCIAIVQENEQAQKDMDELKRIIRSIQSSPLASVEGTSHGPLESNVHWALEKLTKVKLITLRVC